ncbi:biotin--[acetyl-CoA-carboxylase] ligase [Opitutus sp. ER46]|uniref:biotin--[acetyl-CoA-carboxylase] ligase n=1 Tax=Opitutus sp. ER46 TaxID=2161864 RepID=UPI000D2FBBB2|nr:biotin--[acetyl-CoA-carboxylase] ligase [Opitutus sp. ER46]PTX99058.1 biotin--[acetyl-CoA-carboxylase] ligase [Opitutus sp. ER46]
MSIVSETIPAAYPADGWDIAVLDEVDSTNTLAGRKPAWTALRAHTQTGGRGRTRDRRWVSDSGGLWLSAVLPCPGPRTAWEILPLAAGWAVLDALRELGVSGARLRWPNDVMVGRGKLAGLLVERYTAETAVVGIGLNVFNHPERAAADLAGQTVRLADLVPGDQNLDAVMRVVLRSLREAHETVLGPGFGVIADELNRAWKEPRRVEVTLQGQTEPLVGQFHGVDLQGRLRLTVKGRAPAYYDATQVALLRELA